MILSDLKQQVQITPVLSDSDRAKWVERLPSMTREELQALAGLLMWMQREKETGELLKKSGGSVLKKAFTALNKNAYQKSKKIMLKTLEKELD